MMTGPEVLASENLKRKKNVLCVTMIVKFVLYADLDEVGLLAPK